MNQLNIIGNLTGDPTSRTTQEGRTVCNFTVAVNRRKRADGQQEADFFRVAAWGELGTSCQKFLTKGRKVLVTGAVNVNTYTAQDGTTRASLNVLAQDVEFLSPREQGDAAKPQDGGAGEVKPDLTPAADDGLPF